MVGTRSARWSWAGHSASEGDMDETERPSEESEESVERAAESATEDPEPPAGASSAARGPEEPSAQKPAETQAQAEADSPAESGTPVAESVTPRRRASLAQRLAEPEEVPIELPASFIRARTRRDFLILAAGTLA